MNPKNLAKPYEPTEHERVALQAYRARREQFPPAPRMRVVESEGATVVDIDHPDASVALVLLMEAVGTRDHDFLHGLLQQLANAGTQGQKVDASGLNFMLSVVKGVAPRDQVEAMLAVQMAAVHMATMTFARRLGRVENIPQQDSAERAFNKLARTFAGQLEALKRYRTGGEQKVRVEHVHVHSGGQAVVGVVETSAGAVRPKRQDQEHARQIVHAPQPPMRSADAERRPVPVAGDAERTVPDARRTVPGRSEGE
jgi:hypothetical protein